MQRILHCISSFSLSFCADANNEKQLTKTTTTTTSPCLMISLITYHQFHSNSFLDNQVHIGTLVDYILVYSTHPHYNKQNLSMDLLADRMRHLHNLVDIHICMMCLHWYMYHNCMRLEHMHLYRQKQRQNGFLCSHRRRKKREILFVCQREKEKRD